ncbi:MAG: GMP synthetase [Clostridiales Family XIII bacterium]|jgi:GMP synthase (glutamine-hydrolysing)|nr:GMP synthetase [Clostridiales Family XIII bacterium]
MEFESIWVVDFGGQYNQLIARRVREANVYAEIVPYERVMERIGAARGVGCADGSAADGRVAVAGDDREENIPNKTGELPAGIIFTGGPNSVYEDGAPVLPVSFFELGIPILGICYGAQLMAHALGGKVVSPDFKEYGKVRLYQGAGASGSVDGASDNEAGGKSGDLGGITDVPTGANSSAEAKTSELFYGISDGQHCWMSHTDYIAEAPGGFVVTSFTDNCPTASMEDAARKLYGVQFHPEVHHTPFGQELLRNFLYRVCGCKGTWTMAGFVESKIAEIRARVGEGKVLCALSGGVDSSVAAVLTHRAIGDNLTCVFVDHGLLRKGEGDQVMEVYGKQFNMKIIRVDAAERFLSKLAGVDDPERKRKIIGGEFIAVFEGEAAKLMRGGGNMDGGVAGAAGSESGSGVGDADRVAVTVSVPGSGGLGGFGKQNDEGDDNQHDGNGGESSKCDNHGESDKGKISNSEINFLLQGTIYPDVVESGGGGGGAAVIKSHHNVGGLPESMGLELLEPLRLLFKDEVRAVGEELGIAPALVWRQPFPGPGLAIRCLGEITPEKLHIIRESDAILREEIDAYNERLFEKTGKRNYGATYEVAGGENTSGDSGSDNGDSGRDGSEKSDSGERAVWQYFTVLPNIRSVGVMGDSRTYDYAVGIRAVTSVDGMTSDWARLPYDLLETIAGRIVNEVDGVNRVLYDLTSKPPGTIEWE